ncbi:hypothetical protein Tco_0597377 [Tanacetum coccineum]
MVSLRGTTLEEVILVKGYVFPSIVKVRPVEEEPPVKKVKFNMPEYVPDFTIPTPTPLKSVMPQGIRPPVIIDNITIEQYTSTLFSLSSSEFSLTPPPKIVDNKGKDIRLTLLKTEKEKSKKKLKKVMTPAEIQAQAQKLKLDEYEGKRVKTLEEYNHYITHKVDPIPITKISYKINNSTKEAIMRITRNDNSLNLTVYDKFVLKMLGFSEWIEWVTTQAGKLCIPPPPKLTIVRMSNSEKKIKRTFKIIKEVFVNKDIVIDGMHRNLVPPLGVEGVESLGAEFLGSALAVESAEASWFSPSSLVTPKDVGSPVAYWSSLCMPTSTGAKAGGWLSSRLFAFGILLLSFGGALNTTGLSATQIASMWSVKGGPLGVKESNLIIGIENDIFEIESNLFGRCKRNEARRPLWLILLLDL